MKRWPDIFRTLPSGITPAGTRSPGDVPWRSPKGPNVQELQGDLQGTLRGPTKNRWFDKKKCFLDATAFVLHNYYCLQLEKQIFKSCKWGRPRDVYATSCRASREPNDGMFWGRPRDIGHICFENSIQKHIKLTLTGYLRLYSELWWQNIQWTLR